MVIKFKMNNYLEVLFIDDGQLSSFSKFKFKAFNWDCDVIRDGHSFEEIREIITKLPRGAAYVVSENMGRIIKIRQISERKQLWNKK